jgi:putative protein kinase ArgK-like GTPase of G3E family
MKKGVAEECDLVVVNKADGALLQTARHTQVGIATLTRTLALVCTHHDLSCILRRL